MIAEYYSTYIVNEEDEKEAEARGYDISFFKPAFKLALTVTEDNQEYKYYVNEEETDENANTKLYHDGELLSDNYFATNDLMETLQKIFDGEITVYEMSDSMKYNYQCMVDAAEFEQ